MSITSHGILPTLIYSARLVKRIRELCSGTLDVSFLRRYIPSFNANIRTQKVDTSRLCT